MMSGIYFIEKNKKCRLVKHKLGHTCGYVAITDKHPYYNLDQHNLMIQVHGGVTYFEKEEDGNLWVGFDTAHAIDYGFSEPMARIRSEYEDLVFTLEEIKSLASQLTQAEKDGNHE